MEPSGFCVSYLLTLYMAHATLLLLTSLMMMEESSSLSSPMTLVSVFFMMVFILNLYTLLWFIMFELTLYPVLFSLYMSGGQVEKISAALYMGVSTSLPTFLFLIIPIRNSYLTNYMMSNELSMSMVTLFLSKSPIFGFHFWLPKAHVEAPTSLSVILASILLKLGYLGVLLNFYLVSYEVKLLILLISLLGVLVISLTASFCSETKSLAAYSSVTHMSLSSSSLYLSTVTSVTSSFLVVLGHSFVSALMFYLIGTMYHLSNTRALYYSSGLFSLSIVMSVEVMLNLLFNGGTPPALSFLGEFLMFGSVLSLKEVISFFLFIYFLFSYYFSIYMLIHLLKSGRVLALNFSVLHISFLLNFTSLLFFYILMKKNIMMDSMKSLWDS